mmetsp:Transcript_11160/g.21535  ORF Transcript_11160/g.21535 Transcript_11160/m.21535 type:complete len:211 (-) Transcript_11160:883-1515(-)
MGRTSTAAGTRSARGVPSNSPKNLSKSPSTCPLLRKGYPFLHPPNMRFWIRAYVDVITGVLHQQSTLQPRSPEKIASKSARLISPTVVRLRGSNPRLKPYLGSVDCSSIKSPENTPPTTPNILLLRIIRRINAATSSKPVTLLPNTRMPRAISKKEGKSTHRTASTGQDHRCWRVPTKSAILSSQLVSGTNIVWTSFCALRTTRVTTEIV